MAADPTKRIDGYGRSLSTLSEGELSQLVNQALKNYQSLLALSRSPLADSELVGPTLVLDTVSPTADERGRGLRLLLQWAVEQLPPTQSEYPIGIYRPYDDPTWQDPRWWRYNILRHRYIEPLHPDDFVSGGRFTETLMALTGLPTQDAFFDERGRAIREVARRLLRQIQSGEADDTLRTLALDRALSGLKGDGEAMTILGIASAFENVFPLTLLLQMANDETVQHSEETLSNLIGRRYLRSGDDGASLWISPVLQRFLYQREDRRLLAQRHRRIAEWAENEGDLLTAAYHCQSAGDWNRAARMILADAEDLINEMQFGELRRILDRFRADHLEDELWWEVQIVLADLLHTAGENEQALGACRRALQVSVDESQQARVYRRMGKLYERRNALHALRYYRQAAERFTARDPELSILLRDQAWLHIRRREWPEAENNLRLALANAAEEEREERADLYDALASLYYYQNNYDIAINFAETALAMREAIGDERRVAASHNNLGLFYTKQEEFDAAIAAYEDALKTYRKLGNQELIATAQLNIGMAHHLSGRIEDAIQVYRHSLNLAAKIGLPMVEVKAHSNLAEALATAEKEAEARSHWSQGYILSRRAGFAEQSAYFLRLRQEIGALSDAALEPAPAPSEPEQWDTEIDADERILLELVRERGRITARETIEALSVSKATATRRLSSLVDAMLIEKVGKGRGTFYRLAGLQSSQNKVEVETDSSAVSPLSGEEKLPYLDELKREIEDARERLRATYQVERLGLLRPVGSEINGPIQMVADFSQIPDLISFFSLEEELNRLTTHEIDVLPAMSARGSHASPRWFW